MKGYIYHIINTVNNKRYIGQTINFQVRKNTHLRNLRDNKHHSLKLQRAWNKYGEENFIIEAKEVTINNIQDLYYLEIEEIKKYDSYFNGYNMTIGGEGSIRKNFNFEDYCIIRVGNLTFEGMYNKTSKYYDVDITVITDIVKGNTYKDYLDNYNALSEEMLNDFLKIFIKNFDIDINNPPKILNKRKVDYEILRDCLCLMNNYDNIGKTLESILGYSRGTMSCLFRKTRYSKAWEKYEKLSEIEKKEIAEKRFKEWNIKEEFLNRQINQGGDKQAYNLKKEDYYYAFYLQEQGSTYTEVANILNLKPATVKDWFNGRSRKKEKQEYLLLSTEQLEVLKNRGIKREP